MTSHPEVVEKLSHVSVAPQTLRRDQTPEDVVGTVFVAGLTPIASSAR